MPTWKLVYLVIALVVFIVIMLWALSVNDVDHN